MAQASAGDLAEALQRFSAAAARFARTGDRRREASMRTNVGSLMLKNGGGGHRQVGTCQVPHGEADRVLAELVKQMREDG